MNLATFLWCVFICRIKRCIECERWFEDDYFNEDTGLCYRCHKIQENKIFDHTKKRLRTSKENLTDLTQ